MDFSTTHSPPVRITIDGTPYDVPRFLGDKFNQWVAARQKTTLDTALAQVKDDEHRARVALYFQPPPVDLAVLIDEITTPDGADYVIGVCLKAAKVPPEQVLALIAHTDPLLKRELARRLGSAEQAKAQLDRDSGEPEGRGADPLAGSPPTSGGSPTTTATTSPDSAEPIPASTRAA